MNKQINDFTSDTSPQDTDSYVFQEAGLTTKRITFLSIKTTLKTYFDTFYAKYSGDADFYKYSIVTSVATGNITVTVLNYLGATPSVSAPVKIQIGGVIRTITSTLTNTFGSGTNWLNLGSTELATKEVDLFLYFQWNTTTSATNLLIARFPSATFMSDIVNSNTGEKGAMGIINYNSTDKVVNIGRFNAILSAGAGYTWSIPATSIIINSPINETRLLDYVSSIYGDNTAWTVGNGTVVSKYSITGSKINCNFNFTLGTTTTLAGGFFGYSKPFASTGVVTYGSGIIQDGGNANGAYPLVFSSVGFGTQNIVYSSPGTKVTSTFPLALGSGDNFQGSITYNI